MSPPAALTARLAGRLGGFSLDAALHVPAEGVTALVGPSGSGKSTLLRALAGVERLQGEVRVGEAVWQDGARFTPPHRRTVGFVFQRAALLAHLSVRRNLDYGRRRAGVAAAQPGRVARLLQLEPLLERMPQRLSGGERQRVAVARALLTAPSLVARLASRTLHLRAGRIVPAAADDAAEPSLAGLAPADVEALARAALRAGLGPT